MLEISGFVTETFGSAEALLAVDGASRARCLVLDIQLPGMSGFDLHRRLHAAGATPPVIFITGYDSTAARDQAEALGAFAYLPKPFAVEMLVDAVSRAGDSPPAGVA
jgi:FixJ family two-component response regulator